MCFILPRTPRIAAALRQFSRVSGRFQGVPAFQGIPGVSGGIRDSHHNHQGFRDSHHNHQILSKLPAHSHNRKFAARNANTADSSAADFTSVRVSGPQARSTFSL